MNPRPAEAGHEVVWSGTLTVSLLHGTYNGSGGIWGCDNSTNSKCSNALSEDTVTLNDGSTFTIYEISIAYGGQLPDTFQFGATAAFTSEINNYAVEIGDSRFRFDQAGRPRTDTRKWRDSAPRGLLPAPGGTVEVRLVVAHPLVSISASPTTVDEGGSVTITVTLQKALSSRVTIPLVVYGFSAEPGDYGRLASITIPANSLTGTGRIATRQDADIRDDVFGVDLGTLPPEVARGNPWSVSITIVDDDYPDTLSDLQSLPIDYSQQRPASERTPTGAGAGAATCYIGAGNGATEYIRYPDGRIEETTKQDPVIRSMFAC